MEDIPSELKNAYNVYYEKVRALGDGEEILREAKIRYLTKNQDQAKA